MATSGHAKVVLDMAQQVEEQVGVVRTLRQQNSRFLEDSEQAWIDHIVENAGTVIADLFRIMEPVIEKSRGRRKWMREPAFVQHLKSLLIDAPPAIDDLTRLIVMAQSLNSAISLLSCCYDRWKWRNPGTVTDVEAASKASATELSQLLNRRRQRTAEGLDRLVRLASVCLHETRQASLTNSLKRKPGVPAENAGDQYARSVSDTCESDVPLSLIIVETVEKWRQNAEDALSATTQRHEHRDQPTPDISEEQTRDNDTDPRENVVVSTATCAVLMKPNSRSPSKDSSPAPTRMSPEEAQPLADPFNDLSIRANFASNVERRPSGHGHRPSSIRQISCRKPLPTTSTLSPSLSTNSLTSTTSPSSDLLNSRIGVTLDNSFDKESVTDLPGTLAGAKATVKHQLHQYDVDISVARTSHNCHPPWPQSASGRTVSFQPVSPPLPPHQFSRGRALLERQAECGD